jgi:hypothetical protein
MKAKDKNNNWLGPTQNTVDELKVSFIIQNGGGQNLNTRLSVSRKSLGFVDYRFTFNPSDPDQLNNAIISILFYLFSVKNSVAVVSAGYRQFLALNIQRFFFEEDFTHQTISIMPFNLVWGKETEYNLWDHLPLSEYIGYAKEYEKIFQERDITSFTDFNNMKFESQDNNNGKLMLWYIWNRHLKPLFERKLGTDIDLFDLLDNNKDFNLDLDLSWIKL